MRLVRPAPTRSQSISSVRVPQAAKRQAQRQREAGLAVAGAGAGDGEDAAVLQAAAVDLQHRADLVHAVGRDRGLLRVAQAVRQVRQDAEQRDAAACRRRRPRRCSGSGVSSRPISSSSPIGSAAAADEADERRAWCGCRRRRRAALPSLMIVDLADAVLLEAQLLELVVGFLQLLGLVGDGGLGVVDLTLPFAELLGLPPVVGGLLLRRCRAGLWRVLGSRRRSWRRCRWGCWRRAALRLTTHFLRKSRRPPPRSSCSSVLSSLSTRDDGAGCSPAS